MAERICVLLVLKEGTTKAQLEVQLKHMQSKMGLPGLSFVQVESHEIATYDDDVMNPVIYFP